MHGIRHADFVFKLLQFGLFFAQCVQHFCWYYLNFQYIFVCCFRFFPSLTGLTSSGHIYSLNLQHLRSCLAPFEFTISVLTEAVRLCNDPYLSFYILKISIVGVVHSKQSIQTNHCNNPAQKYFKILFAFFSIL